MFDDADPLLARVRALALAYPGADEKVSHGRPHFFTRRTFCIYGGVKYIEGVRMAHDAAILIKPDPDDEPALRQDPRFWVPSYLGPSGWLGLDLLPPDTDADADAAAAVAAGAAIDWDEVAELIDASYRVTAPPTLLRELDAR